jgi:hypothetical protein
MNSDNVMDALEFLEQDVKTYNSMSITGLNNLPFVLYDSVAAIMEAYAKYYHKTKITELNADSLFREVVMRCNIEFPQNEQDLKWFEETCDVKKSGDFFERVSARLINQGSEQ